MNGKVFLRLVTSGIQHRRQFSLCNVLALLLKCLRLPSPFKLPASANDFRACVMDGDSINIVREAVSSVAGLAGKFSQSVGTGAPKNVKLPLVRDRGKKLAFTVSRVLSPEECQRLIPAAEGIGFGVAGLGCSEEQVVRTMPLLARSSGASGCSCHWCLKAGA